MPLVYLFPFSSISHFMISRQDRLQVEVREAALCPPNPQTQSYAVPLLTDS